MFRVAKQFYRLASSNPQSLQKNTYSFFRNCNTCANDPVDILIKKADDLARIGKIRKAEDIYKKIIDSHPTHETAYQRLWNSWVSTRSLKVTQKEFDNFEKKYREVLSPSVLSSSKSLSEAPVVIANTKASYLTEAPPNYPAVAEATPNWNEGCTMIKDEEVEAALKAAEESRRKFSAF